MYLSGCKKTILLHGKENTFRSGHSEVAERFDQVLVFSSEVQEKVYRQIDEESPLNTWLMYFDLMPLAKEYM